MDTLIQTICPQLVHYPLLLAIAEMCFAFFFGGFIFSGFWNLLMILLGGKRQ